MKMARSPIPLFLTRAVGPAADLHLGRQMHVPRIGDYLGYFLDRLITEAAIVKPVGNMKIWAAREFVRGNSAANHPRSTESTAPMPIGCRRRGTD